MSVTGADSPTCRDIRLLLGVYVVGAIDPAERALVDEHLSECPACRDELAGLAGLPAMLSRVPEDDVARLAGNVAGLPEQAEPSPELLNALLRHVAARRRARMWRGVGAAAAAAVIAVGGTATVMDLTGHGTSSHPTFDVATGVNTVAHITAHVDYSMAAWGTAMRVQVTGVKAGTACRFWVITSTGRSVAGAWTVTESGYASPWYSASSRVAPGAIHAFQLTTAGKSLVTIPAS
jgi:predicted anti-sigma-YlaC factor YlaD